MQPHSMCVVSLIGLIWNSPSPVKISKSVVKVEFTKQGSYASHSYELTNIQESSDRRELKVDVMRSGGGLSCTVRARRQSVEEGTEVELTHDTIHIAGLREVFNLYRPRIMNGMNYNSGRYKAFSGEFQALDWKKLDLVCEVKQSGGSFAPVRYQIERTELVLG